MQPCQCDEFHAKVQLWTHQGANVSTMWNETAGVFSRDIHAARLAIEPGVTRGDFVRAIDKIALAAADFEQWGRRP
jgi:hypothetical protein